MTNPEAKQEAIRKAWEEHYEKYKNFIDENGNISNIHLGDSLFVLYGDFEKVFINSKTFWRPASLQGIENNNGWIKIESEADLPKNEDALYWALKNGEFVCIELKTPIDLKGLFSDFLKDKITHYQQIEKPKPPIY